MAVVRQRHAKTSNYGNGLSVAIAFQFHTPMHMHLENKHPLLFVWDNILIRLICYAFDLELATGQGPGKSWIHHRYIIGSLILY